MEDHLTKRAITAFSATALLFGMVAGGAIAAKPENPGSQGKNKAQAAKQCNEEKKLLRQQAKSDGLGAKAGNKAFKESYGDPRSAMRNCKRAARNGENVGTSEFKNAAKFCKSERERLGDEGFVEEYGENENKRNAFGKCVSGEVSNQPEEAGTTPEGESGTQS